MSRIVFGNYANPGWTPAKPDDWRKRAGCRNEDPEMFFPVGDSGQSQRQAAEAEEFCNLFCPVVAQCLRWALNNRIEHGVWGGMSAKKRDKILESGDFVPDPEFRKTRQCKDCRTTFEIPAHVPTATLCELCAAASPYVTRKRNAAAKAAKP